MEEEYRGFIIKYSETDKAFYIDGESYAERTPDLILLKDKINKICAKAVVGTKVFIKNSRWDKELKEVELYSITDNEEYWVKGKRGRNKESRDNIFLVNEKNREILKKIEENWDKQGELLKQEGELWKTLDKPELLLENINKEKNGKEKN